MKTIFKLIQIVRIQNSGDFDRLYLEGHTFDFQEIPEAGHKLIALDLSNGRTLSTTSIKDIRADQNTVRIVTKNTSYTFLKVLNSE